MKPLDCMTYHVVGNAPHHPVGRVFQSLGARPKGISVADLVVYTGGPDIHPRHYHQLMHHTTKTTDYRDEYEISVYRLLSKNQYKIGVCRGGQLLNVLNGGSMYQDADGHRGNHTIKYFEPDGQVRIVQINSTHHQLMKPPKDCLTWGLANESTYKSDCLHKTLMPLNHHSDPEILVFPDTLSLSFQAHPEYHHKPTTDLFEKVLERLITTV